jgi:hypothetical protein
MSILSNQDLMRRLFPCRTNTRLKHPSSAVKHTKRWEIWLSVLWIFFFVRRPFLTIFFLSGRIPRTNVHLCFWRTSMRIRCDPGRTGTERPKLFAHRYLHGPFQNPLASAKRQRLGLCSHNQSFSRWYLACDYRPAFWMHGKLFHVLHSSPGDESTSLPASL